MPRVAPQGPAFSTGGVEQTKGQHILELRHIPSNAKERLFISTASEFRIEH